MLKASDLHRAIGPISEVRETPTLGSGPRNGERDLSLTSAPEVSLSGDPYQDYAVFSSKENEVCSSTLLLRKI